MTRANTDFKEEVKRLNPSVDTQGVLEFDVHNDGVLVIIQVPNVNGSANGSLLAEYPSTLQPERLDTYEVNGNNYKKAFLCSAKLRIEYDILAGSEVFFCVKSISAEAVRMYNEARSEEASFNEQILDGLVQIRELNKAILNHLRDITEIEDSEGDRY